MYAKRWIMERRKGSVGEERWIGKTRADFYIQYILLYSTPTIDGKTLDVSMVKK